MQVWIEFQVRRGTMHSDDRATLRALARARAQAAVVPTEDGVDEQPRDGAEQLTVEGQAATKLMRHREDPLLIASIFEWRLSSFTRRHRSGAADARLRAMRRVPRRQHPGRSSATGLDRPPPGAREKSEVGGVGRAGPFVAVSEVTAVVCPLRFSAPAV